MDRACRLMPATGSITARKLTLTADTGAKNAGAAVRRGSPADALRRAQSQYACALAPDRVTRTGSRLVHSNLNVTF
jgi:hypothetical protein